VLLVPGYGGGSAQLDQIARGLRRHGILSEVVGVDDGTGDLRDYAARVVRRAEQLVAAGQPIPDIIGYSAGGITARIAAISHPSLFRRVITIASPHHGTSVAVLGGFAGQCPTACQQMRPDSPLLDSLGEPQRPADWLSIFSDDDQTILPPDSSELPGAVNYRLQDHCDVGLVDHPQVPTAPQSQAAISAFLAGQPLPDGCAAQGS
jgi:triacylglycerol esterase/lipase EstA (alpha/beta hydrolase family)